MKKEQEDFLFSIILIIDGYITLNDNIWWTFGNISIPSYYSGPILLIVGILYLIYLIIKKAVREGSLEAKK